MPICILKELLLTYTEVDADEAKGFAEELVVMVVSDPSSFIFDDILELAPVKKLADTPVHNVSGEGVWSMGVARLLPFLVPLAVAEDICV